MTQLDALQSRLQLALRLKLPPVAVCFSEETPVAPAWEGSAPAGCLFWQEGAQRTFATTATDHELCAIGVHTHNLADPAPSHARELGKVLEVLDELTYVRPDDLRRLPVLSSSPKHVVYGPLAEAPSTPDAVLLFVDSRQSLVVAEAAEQLDPERPPAMGRPACAVVPQVVNTNRAALSLGCCGARAYLDALSDDVALWALPGGRVAEFVERIEALAAANETLARFHDLRRQDVESGARPTIEESLVRLGG